MFNEIALVKVSHFARKGAEADKNGIANVYLQAVAGSIPNKALVIAGTVALGGGLNIGDTLLVNVTERPADPQYGRQFNVTALGKPTMIEIIQLRKEIGAVNVFDADTEATKPPVTEPSGAKTETV